MPSQVEELKRFTLAEHLWRQRVHRLEAFLSVHGALGEEARTKLQTQAATLSQFLARGGQRAEVPLLLELACLVPGDMRGKPGSIQRIWLEESGRPSRHLKEAACWWHDSMDKVAEALALTPEEHALIGSGLAQASGRQVDALAVLRAIAALPVLAPEGGPLSWVGRFRRLSSGEGQTLVRFALALLGRGTPSLRKTASNLLEMLACLTPGLLKGLHLELLEHGVNGPGFLFLGAGPEVREHLLHLLDAPEALDWEAVNGVLEALAWIGDAGVQRAFSRWREFPPAWASTLHVSPSSYTRQAGWELTPEGRRRELRRNRGHVLVRPPDGAGTDDSPVQVVTPLAVQCGGCNLPLVALLELNLTRPELAFLELPGARLCLAMCERCTFYGTTFTQVDGQGGVRWSPHSTGHEGRVVEEAPLPQRRLMLGPSRLPLEARIAWKYDTGSVSQLGGLPCWIQDVDPPSCPGCNRGMLFVGQVQLSELGDAPEGIVYALLCSDCGFAATSYQQT